MSFVLITNPGDEPPAPIARPYPGEARARELNAWKMSGYQQPHGSMGGPSQNSGQPYHTANFGLNMSGSMGAYQRPQGSMGGLPNNVEQQAHPDVNVGFDMGRQTKGGFQQPHIGMGGLPQNPGQAYPTDNVGLDLSRWMGEYQQPQQGMGSAQNIGQQGRSSANFSYDVTESNLGGHHEHGSMERPPQYLGQQEYPTAKFNSKMTESSVGGYQHQGMGGSLQNIGTQEFATAPFNSNVAESNMALLLSNRYQAYKYTAAIASSQTLPQIQKLEGNEDNNSITGHQQPQDGAGGPPQNIGQQTHEGFNARSHTPDPRVNYGQNVPTLHVSYGQFSPRNSMSGSSSGPSQQAPSRLREVVGVAEQSTGLPRRRHPYSWEDGYVPNDSYSTRENSQEGARYAALAQQPGGQNIGAGWVHYNQLGQPPEQGGTPSGGHIKADSTGGSSQQWSHGQSGGSQVSNGALPYDSQQQYSTQRVTRLQCRLGGSVSAQHQQFVRPSTQATGRNGRRSVARGASSSIPFHVQSPRNLPSYRQETSNSIQVYAVGNSDSDPRVVQELPSGIPPGGFNEKVRRVANPYALDSNGNEWSQRQVNADVATSCGSQEPQWPSNSPNTKLGADQVNQPPHITQKQGVLGFDDMAKQGERGNQAGDTAMQYKMGIEGELAVQLNQKLPGVDGEITFHEDRGYIGQGIFAGDAGIAPWVTTRENSSLSAQHEMGGNLTAEQIVNERKC